MSVSYKNGADILKEQILKHINNIPYGGTLYGIEARQNHILVSLQTSLSRGLVISLQ